MEDDKKKSLSRRYKEQLLVYSRKHPRTLKWLEKKLAKEIEISDEKYKEFNQSPLYRFYSTEAATRVTPSMHYERFAKDAVVALPDPSAVYLVYVVRGNIRLLRRNPKARGKKKTVRLCTFTGGSYFYRVRGGSALACAGASGASASIKWNCLVWRSRTKRWGAALMSRSMLLSWGGHSRSSILFATRFASSSEKLKPHERASAISADKNVVFLAPFARKIAALNRSAPPLAAASAAAAPS